MHHVRLLLLLALAVPAFAQRTQPLPSGAPIANPAAPAETANDTDPSYRLTAGDSVNVGVYGEPDMSVSQRLDSSGVLRLPMVGDVRVSGLSVREAEESLERLYRERELLKEPLVSITVTNYALREVSVLGAVRSPGNFQFPKEATSLDIADLITRLGGFTPTAKSDSVSVIRKKADGSEEVTTVDVERMISGRRRGDASRRDFLVYPGDRIWVPERLF